MSHNSVKNFIYWYQISIPSELHSPTLCLSHNFCQKPTTLLFTGTWFAFHFLFSKGNISLLNFHIFWTYWSWIFLLIFYHLTNWFPPVIHIISINKYFIFVFSFSKLRRIFSRIEEVYFDIIPSEIYSKVMSFLGASVSTLGHLIVLSSNYQAIYDNYVAVARSGPVIENI